MGYNTALCLGLVWEKWRRVEGFICLFFPVSCFPLLKAIPGVSFIVTVNQRGRTNGRLYTWICHRNWLMLLWGLAQLSCKAVSVSEADAWSPQDRWSRGGDHEQAGSPWGQNRAYICSCFLWPLWRSWSGRNWCSLSSSLTHTHGLGLTNTEGELRK